jgi:hypothetical protein
VSIDDDASHNVYIIIHIFSVKRLPTMKVNIHNQCSDFKLKYGGYFPNGIGNGNVGLVQEIDTDSMKSIDLEHFLATYEGIVAYALRRKHVKPGNQTESAEILLSVAWKSEGYKNFRVLVHLIEYNKWSYGGVIKMKEYYQRYADQLSTYTGPIEDTWLIDDGIVLMTRLELNFTQRDGVLNVAISEGIGGDRTKRLEWITPNK